MPDVALIPTAISLASLVLTILIWRSNQSNKLKEQVQQHETDIAVIKSQMVNSKEQLDNIDGKLDDIIKELI